MTDRRVATEIQTEKRAEEVNRKAVLLAQQIMYEVKTDRQVKHEPKPNTEEKPFRHAFTGCDQMGTICGKSKISCWNTLKKADEQVLEAFASLGSSEQVTADVTEQLELYMCQLYAPLTQFKTVKELRWFLLSKRQYSDEKLPPTKAALEQMIKRANYVALVWKN